MTKTIKEIIKVMQHYENGGEVECVKKVYDNWETVINPCWNQYNFNYRIKEFQYPIWCKSTDSDLVVRFNSLKRGEVVIEDSQYVKGDYASDWVSHTNKEFWIQVEDPNPTLKVTIEKWLIEESSIQFVIETSDIDSWLKSFPTAKKLKLIESYEVEI